MSYCIVFLVLHLQFECDVHTVGKFEGGIMVVYEPSIVKELEVLEAEDFSSLYLLLLNLEVLAQMHGDKKGKDGELGDCTLELHQFLFGDFGNEACGDGFLLMFLWVGIFCRLGIGIVE
jgi:hypothetical protein